MSIRRIARECKSAVGTIYNYFKGKDDLAANIILKDWLISVNSITEQLKSCKFYPDGVVIIYHEIQKFEDIYKNIWKKYSETVGSHGVITEYHLQFRNNVSRLLETLAKNTGRGILCDSSTIIAEAVISATFQPDMDELTVRRFAELL